MQNEVFSELDDRYRAWRFEIWLTGLGTLRVATNCFITALNWSTGKQTVVDTRLVS